MFVAPSDRPRGERPAKPNSEGALAIWVPLLLGIVLAAFLTGEVRKEGLVRAGPAQQAVKGPL